MPANNELMPPRFRQMPQWLIEHFGVSQASITQIARLSGGAIQQNWLLDCELDGELQHWVLRTNSPSTLTTSHSRAEEFAVLQLVFNEGIAVPEPIALCTDTSIIGAPFYIMSRLKGEAQANRIVRDQALASYGDALAEELGAQLAKLHSLKNLPASLDFLVRPEGNPAQHRINRYRADLDAIPEPQPVLEYLLSWLEDHQPNNYHTTLCHTDYRTGNYLVEQGKLTGILDWEFASISDPDEDIGWFTARCWRFGNAHLEAGGVADLDAFCRGYESNGGESVDRTKIPYWQVMAEVRWAVIALQQAHRHYSGHEVSLELALTGLMVSEMEFNALQQVQQLDNGF